jgi:proliferating cell nuclear antigen
MLNFFFYTDSDRIAEYDMKLMDIDSDTLGIPETEYEARVTMPSSEFTRIVRDLSQLGESVRIEVSKEGVRFASEGEAANGSVLLRQAEGAAISGGKITAKKDGDEDEEEKDGDEEEAEGSTSQKKDKKKANVKKEKKDDEDIEMDDEDGKDDGDDFKLKGDDDGEEEKEDEEDEDEDEDGSSKKRKKKVTLFFLFDIRFGC